MARVKAAPSKGPDIEAYHKSLTAELIAVRNRIRHLVHYEDIRAQSHWPTDGEWKEAVLRTVLRRHIPDSAVLGRGFVVASDYCSTQIDLIVLCPHKPTLFRDEELLVVSPDAPSALVSVKTKLTGFEAWHDALSELALIGKQCIKIGEHEPFLGLFVYDEEGDQSGHIRDALCKVGEETQVAIHCVSSGPDHFSRFWPEGHFEEGGQSDDHLREFWRVYLLKSLAPAYFIGNLIDALCDVDRDGTSRLWFTYKGGKHEHMIADHQRNWNDCSNIERLIPAKKPRLSGHS